jgi:RNA recognition motif-containing protein
MIKMYKIKITNLPRWISEIHLKQFFNGCGKMVQANVALDEYTLRPLGHGYITFADEEALNKALEKNGAMLDGSIIEVNLDTGIEVVPEADLA